VTASSWLEGEQPSVPFLEHELGRRNSSLETGMDAGRHDGHCSNLIVVLDAATREMDKGIGLLNF
jgi:hypothetical protein